LPIFLTFFIFISCSCLYYNLLSLIISENYRKFYNIFNYYTNLYFDDHPEEDYDAKFEDIKKYYKIKFSLEAFAHILVLIILVKYFFLI